MYSNNDNNNEHFILHLFSQIIYTQITGYLV